MSDTTKIEWCDHSWSPWEGCTKVSPGCLNCYAEARDKRHLFGPESHWGKGAPRRLTKDWRKPVKWNQTDFVCRDCGKWDPRPLGDCACGQYGATGQVRRQRVFPSVCDWLDAEVPIEWLARFLQLIHDTPNLDWLLLTKRPENFHERLLRALAHAEGIDYATADAWEGDAQTELGIWLNEWLSDDATPPSNVWIGTSVEDQQRAEERIPALLKIPARIRFVSCEPLIGPIKFSRVPGFNLSGSAGIALLKNLWVIVGGESGRGARPCNVAWVRSIVRQCQDASVPCFVKQLGACPVVTVTQGQAMPDYFRAFSHPKCGDPAEWPEDLRVRQFPEVKP